jgi:prepilin-type processing-associated H-X9-DG protein
LNRRAVLAGFLHARPSDRYALPTSGDTLRCCRIVTTVLPGMLRLKHQLPSKSRGGFSLLEAVISIGVIGAVLALLLPSVADSHEAARRTQCSNHLKRIGVALSSYHEVHRAYPPGALFSNELSWHAFILPHLDQAELHGRINFNEGQYWSLSPNAKSNPFRLTRVNEYLCPSGTIERSQTSLDNIGAERAWTTHYYGIMGPRGPKPNGAEYRLQSGFGPFGDQGLLSPQSHRRQADIIDGAANTFIVGEISWSGANAYRTWLRGVNGHPVGGCKNVFTGIGETAYDNATGFNDVSLGSEHPGGAQVLMADGAVRFVAEIVDLATYRAAASADGEEDLTLD